LDDCPLTVKVSLPPYIEHPDQSFGIAPLRLTLDDEGLAADRELIPGARVRELARPHSNVAV
jgi:hypothetical protein